MRRPSLRALAGPGARAAAPTADRHGRRSRTTADARPHGADAVRWRALRPQRRPGRTPPAPVGREQLAARAREPRAPRPRARARADGARPPLTWSGERGSLSHDVRQAARLPQAVP